MVSHKLDAASELLNLQGKITKHNNYSTDNDI